LEPLALFLYHSFEDGVAGVVPYALPSVGVEIIYFTLIVLAGFPAVWQRCSDPLMGYEHELLLVLLSRLKYARCLLSVLQQN
jgi:hypothetical protein